MDHTQNPNDESNNMLLENVQPSFNLLADESTHPGNMDWHEEQINYPHNNYTNTGKGTNTNHTHYTNKKTSI